MKNNLDKPVHKDSRGEIRRFDFGGAKFNVLFTKKGALRSGDVHPMRQFDIILKGKFEITMRQGNKNVKITKGANEFVVIPPNTPHLFEALENTVAIEWWDGPFSVEYYEPYRKLVEEQPNK